MERRPSLVPDLYHIKRTTISGPDVSIEICGTYTDISVAQAAGLRRLLDEGYSKSSFAEFHENNGNESWKFGPDVLVHGKLAKSGDILEVEVESTPNSLGVRSKSSGRVEESLFYVVQTKEDKLGKIQKTAVRGIYLSRQAAVTAARHELLDHDFPKEWYRDYQEIPRKYDEEGREEVVIRAVGPEGEKYVVTVLHET